LKSYSRVCVVPDSRVRNASKYPYFSIIDENSRSLDEKKKGKIEGGGEFDVRRFKSNIQFFTHLNKQAIWHYEKKKKKKLEETFYSGSLEAQHKKPGRSNSENSDVEVKIAKKRELDYH
jgi:hypothetical protein